jgi:tetratricopeptide (TPR) repeat protein
VAATELGIALFTEQHFPEAAEQFKRALILDPKYTDARFDLASVEAEGGDLEMSVNDFKEVLAERPDYPKARDHLGQVLFAMGDDLAKSGNNEQAVARYREAVTYLGDSAELHTSLGAALARLGRMSEAQAELQSALRANPNFEPAQRILAAIQSR